jgi:hypothetical protein
VRRIEVARGGDRLISDRLVVTMTRQITVFVAGPTTHQKKSTTGWRARHIRNTLQGVSATLSTAMAIPCRPGRRAR